ncbi:XRE family transcriptional regulator [bacterium]|nr:XRE family transcriptional regulator [bacterium]
MIAGFGDTLKSLRRAKQMTQKELAKIMNVNLVTICHWEKGKQEPCIEDIKKLCQFFEVSSDYLLGIYKFWL